MAGKKLIKAQSLQILQSLSQKEYSGIWRDLHNDYDCVKISLENDRKLTLLFNKVGGNEVFRLKFLSVIIEKLDFFVLDHSQKLTVDSLYRGRFEKNGELVEYREDGSGYFYLEFDEGQSLEFWSTGLDVEM